MNDVERELRDMIRGLQIQIDDIKGALNIEREQTTMALREIEDALWPVVFKVMPEMKEKMKKRVEAAMASKRTPGDLIKMAQIDVKNDKPN